MRLSTCFRVISSAARENVNSFRAFVAGLRGRTFTPEHDFIYVRSLEDWQKAYALLKENSSIAVDLEANSLHYYPESICLIQIGCPGYNFIVDPEAVGGGELHGREVILTGSIDCLPTKSPEKSGLFTCRELSRCFVAPTPQPRTTNAIISHFLFSALRLK